MFLIPFGSRSWRMRLRPPNCSSFIGYDLNRFFPLTMYSPVSKSMIILSARTAGRPRRIVLPPLMQSMCTVPVPNLFTNGISQQPSLYPGSPFQYLNSFLDGRITVSLPVTRLARYQRASSWSRPPTEVVQPVSMITLPHLSRVLLTGLWSRFLMS